MGVGCRKRAMSICCGTSHSEKSDEATGSHIDVGYSRSLTRTVAAIGIALYAILD